jgi:MoxR-like ATPase
MTDRRTKERKLMTLMITDLELDLEQPEMIEVEQEVRALPDEELDRTLASRLDLPYPADEQEMEQSLSRLEEPELTLGGETGSVSGTAGIGHELRPGEHEG